MPFLIATIAAAISAVPRAGSVELALRVDLQFASAASPVLFVPGSPRHFDADQLSGGTIGPYGAGLGGEFELGYRFPRLMSAGITIGARESTSSPPPAFDFRGLSRTAISFGVYMRAYAMFVPVVTPWLSLGAEYVGDTQTYSRITTVDTNHAVMRWTLAHNGIGVPATLGFDYHLLASLAIGLSLRYERALAHSACATVGTPGASTTFCSSDTPATINAIDYDTWSAGVHARSNF